MPQSNSTYLAAYTPEDYMPVLPDDELETPEVDDDPDVMIGFAEDAEPDPPQV